MAFTATPAELAAINHVRSLLRCACLRKPAESKQLAEAERWKNLFQKVDTDGSGTLELSEMRRMCRKELKLSNNMLPENHIRAMHSSLDVDSNGRVEFAEFYNWLKDRDEQERSMELVFKAVGRALYLALQRSKKADNVEELFKMNDRNNDGVFSQDELRVFFREVLQLTPHEVSDRSIKRIFKYIDDDDTQNISSEEFTQFIQIFAQKAPAIGQQRVESAGTGYLTLGHRLKRPDSVPDDVGIPFRLSGREVPGRSRLSMFDLTAQLQVNQRLSGAGIRGLKDGNRPSSSGSLPSAGQSAVGFNSKDNLGATWRSDVSSKMSTLKRSNTASASRFPSKPRSGGEENSPKKGVLRPRTGLSAPGGHPGAQGHGSGGASGGAGDSGAPRTPHVPRAPGTGKEWADPYRLFRGADAMNRIEKRLFEAGIDVRGHLHRSQSAPGRS